MVNNNYFEELIVSYLSGNLSVEEEAFIVDWINSSEEKKLYFEEVRRLWNLLSVDMAPKSIDTDSEWAQFEQVISAKQEEYFSSTPEMSNNKITANAVIENVLSDRKGRIRTLFMSTAIAVSVLLIVAVLWKLNTNNATVERTFANNINNEIASPLPNVRYQLNTTDKPKDIVLKDGSEVQLYGKSVITYHEPFIGNRRDITLVGKASFKVAKDKTKPFRVFTGDISTTALGTQFTVAAFGNEKNIIVRLHEGSVKIRSENNAKRKLPKDIFLVPGQELIYNNKEVTAKIRKYKKEDAEVGTYNNVKETFLLDSLSIPQLRKGSWYMFNNQSLGHVFEQLEDMFNVDIVYNKEDVAKMYFLGTFNKSDSLDNILKQITSLNNLKVSKINNKFIITK